MKILACIGSNRKQGNTARLVQRIEARMQALAAQKSAFWALPYALASCYSRR